MKKYLIVLSVLVLSSCSASWHINRAEYKDPSLFEVKRDTIIKIEKRDTIIHLDTLISIVLPNDKVIIDTTFKKLKPYSFKPIYSENGIINVKVWMKEVLYI